MVGVSVASHPQHHRGASIVWTKKDPTPVTSKGGCDLWFNNSSPKPNVLVGAVVEGPDKNDGFTDSRANLEMMAAPIPTTPAPLFFFFS